MRMASCGLAKTIFSFYKQGEKSAFERERSRLNDIEEKGHKSYCRSYLKDSVNLQQTCSLCIFYRSVCGDCNKKAFMD